MEEEKFLKQHLRRTQRNLRKRMKAPPSFMQKDLIMSEEIEMIRGNKSLYDNSMLILYPTEVNYSH